MHVAGRGTGFRASALALAPQPAFDPAVEAYRFAAPEAEPAGDP